MNSAHYYLAHHYAAQYPFLNFPEKKYQINSAQTSFLSPGQFWPGPLNGTAFPPGPQAHKPGPGLGICRARRSPVGPLRPRDARAIGWNLTAVVASTPHKTAVRPRPPQTLGHSLPPSLSFSLHPVAAAASELGERRGTAASSAERLAGAERESGTARAPLAGAACRRCGRAAPSSVARRCSKGTSPAACRSAAAATANFRSSRRPATAASRRARGRRRRCGGP